MIINIPTSLWLKLNLPRKDYFSTSQKYHKMLGFQRVWEKSFGVSVSCLNTLTYSVYEAEMARVEKKTEETLNIQVHFQLVEESQP